MHSTTSDVVFSKISASLRMNSCHELHCNKMLSMCCLNLMLGVTYIQQFDRVLYLQVSIAFFYFYKFVFFKYHGHVLLKIL